MSTPVLYWLGCSGVAVLDRHPVVPLNLSVHMPMTSNPTPE